MPGKCKSFDVARVGVLMVNCFPNPLALSLYILAFRSTFIWQKEKHSLVHVNHFLTANGTASTHIHLRLRGIYSSLHLQLQLHLNRRRVTTRQRVADLIDKLRDSRICCVAYFNALKSFSRIFNANIHGDQLFACQINIYANLHVA